MYAFIDYSNIAHAVWQTVKTFEFSDCLDEEAIDERFFETIVERMIVKLRTIETHLPGAEQIIVLDNFPAHKSDLYPRYKMNRIDRPSGPVHRLVEWAKQEHRGKVVESPDNEADDTIATLCSLESNAIVVGCDKDLWQLMNGKVQIFNPIQLRFMTPDDVSKAFYGLEADKIPLYKACWGDVADNVPNAFPRMQRRLVPIIRESDGTWIDFSNQVSGRYWNLLPDRCRLLYFLHEGQAEINYSIVKLNTDCELLWHT